MSAAKTRKARVIEGRSRVRERSWVGERSQFEERSRKRSHSLRIALWAVFCMSFLLAAMLAFGALSLPGAAIAAEAQAPSTDKPGESATASEQQEGLVENCGLAFVLPDSAVAGTVAYDRGVWEISYDSGGILKIAAVSSDEGGDEDADIERFANENVEVLASNHDDAIVSQGIWRTYGDVMVYARGYAASDGILMLVATAPGDGRIAALAFLYTGDNAQEAQQDILDVLDSLKLADWSPADRQQRGPLAYYDVVDLMGLTSQQVVDVLEEGTPEVAGLLYTVEGGAYGFTGWLGDDAGPAGALQGCAVVLYTKGDAQATQQTSGAMGLLTVLTEQTASTIEPVATRDMALEGVDLSGIEVSWYAVPSVEWDEASDLGSSITKACGLTGVLDDGYTSELGGTGSYSWARIGACEIAGEEAYWMISIEAPDGSAGTCTVTLSCDLLQNGHGGGFADYDELVRTVLGSR